MKIRVLGCYGGQLLGFHLTSFLINDTVLLDAGSPTEVLTLEEQSKIEHIFLSHTHLDHIKDIAFLADNRALKRFADSSKAGRITIHSLQDNLDTLSKHFLNNIVWPDFTKIPTKEKGILRMESFEAEQVLTVGDLEITPIKVEHPVPCTGFLLNQDGAQAIFTADTGHTDRIWEIANQQPNLKAVIIDCSFPNNYEKLANMSGHLTPKGMAQELKKLDKLGSISIYLYHMKPEVLTEMASEVEAEDIPHLRMLTQVDELVIKA
ncbi:MAG: 3',5'-cyclic-nucleotide phosphodiesterase [Ghiorsea sp.]|nr:3',5'-cyclic-nucleotide phosphodiesterase [Ghiorsea sp.]